MTRENQNIKCTYINYLQIIITLILCKLVVISSTLKPIFFAMWCSYIRYHHMHVTRKCDVHVIMGMCHMHFKKGKCHISNVMGDEK